MDNQQKMGEIASKKSGGDVGYLVFDRSKRTDAELQGYQFGGAHVCLIFIDLEPGDGPRLHRHPYEEIFILLEGRPTRLVRTRWK